MPRYGEVPTLNPLLSELKAKKEGVYELRLYPQLWGSPELAAYYRNRQWQVVEFTTPPPPLPKAAGIYMFVVGPYCGDIRDHSYIFYVGKTVNIRKRYKEYVNEKDGKCTNPRENVMMFLNHFCGYLHFHFTLVPRDELSHAEDLLKDNLTPIANTQLNLIGRLT